MTDQTHDTAGHSDETSGQRHEEILGKTLSELEAVGRAWADHGLRVGAAALETSAQTLSHTANLLQSIASTLGAQKQ